MRVKSVVLSAVLALLVVSAQKSNAQTAPAPAPAAPAAQPAVIPGSAPAQQAQIQPQQSYPPQAQFNPNGLLNSWVSDCVPQGTWARSHLVPNQELFRQRAMYTFATGPQGQLLLTFQIFEYRDPFCSQAVADVVRKDGVWRFRSVSPFDPTAGELVFNYDFCRDDGSPYLNNPDYALCSSSVHLAKMINNVLVFGRNVATPAGLGAAFDYNRRFYLRGTEPTAFIAPQGY